MVMVIAYLSLLTVAGAALVYVCVCVGGAETETSRRI